MESSPSANKYSPLRYLPAAGKCILPCSFFFTPPLVCVSLFIDIIFDLFVARRNALQRSSFLALTYTSAPWPLFWRKIYVFLFFKIFRFRSLLSRRTFQASTSCPCSAAATARTRREPAVIIKKIPEKTCHASHLQVCCSLMAIWVCVLNDRYCFWLY